ncbi:MAG: S41 family peptidase [Phycisphaerae bacterium]|nr:S41 family peptidase [Phycisphaerae bacterium]
MAARYARLALLVGLLLAPVWAVAGDETLATAYAAILRGDYDAGRATIERLATTEHDAAAGRVQNWLEDYHKVVASRKELKAKTFEWNIEQAQKALADAKPFVALNFVAQAVPYAPEGDNLTSLPWVVELTKSATETARQLEQEDHWKDALNYYLLLTRIHPKDEELRAASENAVRHARIELAYKDQKSLQERIRRVDKGLLRSAVKLIDHLYYREPDFRELATGALDNLVTLASVTKLREYMDGLGNPTLREHFVKRLGELRKEVQAEKSYGQKDLLRLFNQVNDLNRESIEIPESLLVVEFLEGAIGKLDDYTGMIWPADAVDFEKMMMGGFEGVGIQLGMDERTNRLKVVTPLENSPALEAGVHPDDLIIAVDDQSTSGWDTDDAVRNIMGPAGTEVVLTIQRPSTGETIPFKLSRRRIVLPTVRGLERVPGDAKAWNYMLDKDAGVAYIRLTGFHPDSADELREALDAARAQGMKGLVLDVRYNPGGLLDVAIDIVSTFLPEGEVVSTRGRVESDQRERVGGAAAYKDLPLVVLANDSSASASEILAGALQDHHRALILGERTFGKGSVQHVRPLNDDAKLKLTTALYYLPSGRSPHKAPKAEQWGVEPDWELKLTPKELRRVIERERETYIIHNEQSSGENKALSEDERARVLDALKADEKSQNEDPPLLSEDDIKQLEADPNEAPKVDPQLETALLLVRVKLAANLPWPREFVAAAKQP